MDGEDSNKMHLPRGCTRRDLERGVSRTQNKTLQLIISKQRLASSDCDSKSKNQARKKMKLLIPDQRRHFAPHSSLDSHGKEQAPSRPALPGTSGTRVGTCPRGCSCAGLPSCSIPETAKPPGSDCAPVSPGLPSHCHSFPLPMETLGASWDQEQGFNPV